MSVDILVFTCAAYSHLIPKFLTCFERTFPLPYQLTYVVAGTDRVQVPRNYNRAVTKFVTLPHDYNTAANMLDYLAYRGGNAPFLMLMDDHMVFEADAKLIQTALEYISLPNTGCVRLVPWPGPTIEIKTAFPNTPYDYYGFGEIDKSLEYAISLQASFWKPQTFLDLLDRSWSPWDIELRGSQRAANYDKRFIGCKTCAINYKDYMLRGGRRPVHADWVDANG
jgi:hypothetical protein